MISVIIPTLNDATRLPRALAPLVFGVADGLVKQAIIADGGSADDTIAIAEAAGCDVVRSAPGFAKQALAGVAAAKGRWFLFLSPGAMLQDVWLEEARRFLAFGDGRAATFPLLLEEHKLEARAFEIVALLRGMIGRPRAENGLLISRALYEKVGGVFDIPDAYANLIARIGAKRLTSLRSRLIYREAAPLEAAPALRASSGV